LVCWVTVLLNTLSWSWIHYIEQAGLELMILLAPTSQVLGLQLYAIMSSDNCTQNVFHLLRRATLRFKWHGNTELTILDTFSLVLSSGRVDSFFLSISVFINLGNNHVVLLQMWKGGRTLWKMLQQLTHSLTYSLTHSFTHSLTYSLIHPLTYSLTHSLAHSLTHIQQIQCANTVLDATLWYPRHCTSNLRSHGWVWCAPYTH
jgi:hypothetical protein